VKVIDNKVSKALQNKIEEYFLHNNFPWYYNDNSLGKHVPKKYRTITKDSFNEFQLTHKFVDEGRVNSPHTNIIMNLLSELDMEGTPILRCKANLKFRTNTKKKHNGFHVDHKDPHKVMIYYANDSDGDTFLKIGKSIKRVSPKKGRVLCFDGKTMHAANHPRKTNKRLIINFNLL
tara:strand:+ start:1020 stop:1547 length:528 start_codon:yes stop_codon:yes gene_type:complete